MSDLPSFLRQPHDDRDPNPWRALYLDQSVPMNARAKAAWLEDVSSPSRQFLLPVLRPLARGSMLVIQLFRVLFPRALASARWLHLLLEWGMKAFLSPNANWLILRHFHLGSEILRFIGDNVRGVDVATVPLKPLSLDAVRDNLFVQHDLNLFNFVIKLNEQLTAQGRTLEPRDTLDFAAISTEPAELSPMPRRFLNFIDVQTAIELYTPLYQLLLTDHDFWRATNSLQLDETLGVYVAKLLGSSWQLSLVNNKHPMVPMTTLGAGYRLVLHGLATECLHALLVKAKQNAETRVP